MGSETANPVSWIMAEVAPDLRVKEPFTQLTRRTFLLGSGAALAAGALAIYSS